MSRGFLPRVCVIVLASAAVACDTDTAQPLAPVWPRAEVELVTDDLGISHVFASDDEDAFFGAGYAMARDRLFQMEIARRRARGRLAQVLGSRFFKDDLGARAFDFSRLGLADLERVRRDAPGDAALVDAWVAGVNARIGEIREGRAPRPYGLGAAELDFVPEAFVAEDAFAVGKLLAFGLSSSIDSELLATALLRLAPSTSPRFLSPCRHTTRSPWSERKRRSRRRLRRPRPLEGKSRRPHAVGLRSRAIHGRHLRCSTSGASRTIGP